MKAIKLSATVGRDRTLFLQLPTETPEGLAEVIVLVPDGRSQSTHVDTLLENAARWRSENSSRRSKQSIDQALREERSSWGPE